MVRHRLGPALGLVPLAIVDVLIEELPDDAAGDRRLCALDELSLAPAARAHGAMQGDETLVAVGRGALGGWALGGRQPACGHLRSQ